MTKTGTGKCERLLACQGLAAIPPAVAWRRNETSLAGAIDAAKQGLIIPILVGPTATIAEVAKKHDIDLGRTEIVDAPDILLAPDLEAGNMMAKQLTFLANADCAGLVLGAPVPVILTSRADSLGARIASCAAAVLVAHARRQPSS